MVINKLFYLLLFLFIQNKFLYSSEILDYETELFINELISDIKVINGINKEIKFKILSDENINAFVDQNNIIYITSGLIKNCDDYIALLSVIAHEIGHIDHNHIKDRIFSNNKLNDISKFTNLSIIASSLLLNNPEIIKGMALSAGTLSEYNINFSKDQEREADYYSLETLKKLNIYSDSIIKLLEKIEKNSMNKGITKEKLKYSTHPYFEERIGIIKYLNYNQGHQLNQNLNIKFKFIKAKFIGYSENKNQFNNLDDLSKKYSNSIQSAKNGDLKRSLINLNELISNFQNNYFLIETKADILFSYGYTKESLKFYNKVLKNYPDNKYAQIRVLENINIKELSDQEMKNLFSKNLNLLEKYYNNKNLLQIYLQLSKFMNKYEWEQFLYYWINKKNHGEEIKKKLKKYIISEDNQLSKLAELIYNNK